MSKPRIGMSFALATLSFPLPISPTSAQTYRGRLTGTLAGQSEAVVAGRNVNLTNLDLACLAMRGSTHEEEL
jgi:hypothetical protein